MPLIPRWLDLTRDAVAEMKDGDVILLRTPVIRAEETKNGEAFSMIWLPSATCL